MDPCSCRHTNVETAEDGAVCTDCGYVLTHLVTSDVEWRNTSDDTRIRCDMYGVDAEDEMHSSIVGGRLRGTGNESRTLIRHTRKAHVRDHIYINGKERIRAICASLNAGGVVTDDAIGLLRALKEEHRAWRGSRRTGLIVACISLACLRTSTGITDTEILKSPLVREPTRVMNKQKKAVQQLLYRRDIPVPITPIASEYCFRITSKLGFPRQLAMKVSKTASRLHNYAHMRAKSCVTVVAVSIILLAEKRAIPVDVETLCVACDVTYPTLCKWYSDATSRGISESKEILGEIYQLHIAMMND